MEVAHSHVIGSFIDGRLAVFDPTIVDPRPPQRALVPVAVPVTENVKPAPAPASAERAIAKPAPTIDDDPLAEIARHLAAVTRITQSLGPRDRRRARELVNAASSLLAASTVLDTSDQELFQDAVRASHHGAD